jgi:hypothetical protein
MKCDVEVTTVSVTWVPGVEGGAGDGWRLIMNLLPGGICV